MLFYLKLHSSVQLTVIIMLFLVNNRLRASVTMRLDSASIDLELINQVSLDSISPSLRQPEV
jgi:hypothetical protein